ncbi:MAG: hypothetical protein BroJett041_23620 [Candidatus Jettenia caeni]|nr:MAG: hypothetical protein BroJett041_23620 [Candidatus Jettenia caeni]
MPFELSELEFVEDLLPKNEWVRKRMFGGLSYYIDGKMMLVMFEDTTTRSYKNKKFPYAIWNGCLLPLEREFHAQLIKAFPALSPHPVLGKWLYLPLETENFDDIIERIINHLSRHRDIWGIYPKSKKTSKKKVQVDKDLDLNMDISRPRMFSESDADFKISKKTKITELKNLGPATEKEFLAVGIKTAHDLKKLGWKKAMIKLIDHNPKNAHLIFAKAIIGGLTNKPWFQIDAQTESEAKEFLNKIRSDRKKKKTVVKTTLK